MKKSQNKLSEQEKYEIEAILEAVEEKHEALLLDPEISVAILSRTIPACPEMGSNIANFFSLFKVIFGHEINNRYYTISEERELTGLLGMYGKYLDPTFHGCSKAGVRAAFKSERYVRDLHDMLSDYAQATGCLRRISKSEIETRVSQLAANTPRTIERNFELAEGIICNVLGEHREYLYNLVKSSDSVMANKTVNAAGTSGIPRNNDVNVESLIFEYTLREWSYSPLAFGFQVPIESCATRLLRVVDERYTIGAAYLANHLVGYCGTISGFPGSGRTTAALLATYFGNLEPNHRCYMFYLPLMDYVEYARKGLDYTYHIADWLCRSADSNLLSNIRSRVAELQRHQKLILVCDDFEKLPVDLQSLVLSQLSVVSSVFYVASPWSVKRIERALREYRYSEGIKALQLVDLDPDTRKLIASRAAEYLHVAYSNSAATDFFAELYQEGMTPLEVIAATKSNTSDDTLKYLEYTKQLFFEFLRRDGCKRIYLPLKAEELDNSAARIIWLGRAIREVLLNGPKELVPSSDDYWATVFIPLDLIKTIIAGPIDDILCSGLVRYDGGSRLRLINRRMETFLAAIDWYYAGNSQFSFLKSLMLGLISYNLYEISKMAPSIPLILD